MPLSLAPGVPLSLAPGVPLSLAPLPAGWAPGGVFTRTPSGRTFGRAECGRTFIRPLPGDAPMDYLTHPHDSDEVRVYLFDYSNFPEILDDETIESAVVIASDGLDVGAVRVSTRPHKHYPEGRALTPVTIPAGQAVEAVVAGGTPDALALLECRATLSGGGVVVVKGALAVE